MQIGDEVYVHGYVDEIRDGHVIIRNDGGYFGTVRSEIRPNDEDVGKPCWKIYVIAERRRFPKTYYDYFCDAPHVVEHWKKFILNGGDATLYARERPFTKSDRTKLGKTVFWTKKEAEDAIGIVYTAETPQTKQSDSEYYLELADAVMRGEMSDAGANQAWYEYINHKDEQTEREGE